jgi:hypothetical protein
MRGLDTTQKFGSLFMFPRVCHYSGGYGQSHFDMVTAIAGCIEHGTAPDRIMTTKYSGDNEQQPGAPTGESESGVDDDASVIQTNVSGANGIQPNTTPVGTNQCAGFIMPTGGNPNKASGAVIRTLPAYPYPWCAN